MANIHKSLLWSFYMCKPFFFSVLLSTISNVFFLSMQLDGDSLFDSAECRFVRFFLT